MLTIASLIFALFIILIAAEMFTNALEHLGERLKISEGVTGSIFAAVGTALPETLVPLLAIFAGTENITVNEEIGVGAILGAPLMLSTLSISLLALVCWKKRRPSGDFTPERSGFIRDLNFFLVAFSFATIALFVPHEMTGTRVMIGFTLVLTYFVYVLMTLRASASLVQEGHGTEANNPMLLTRIGLPHNYFIIALQLIISLGLLVAGAKIFIHDIDAISRMLEISPLVLSLLIIPIATELPEKVNSILWVRQGKDTLAFGNITGAMVFQGTLLPAIGIMLTPWEPRPDVLAGILVTLLAAIWLRSVLMFGQLKVWHLLVNGIIYLCYLYVVLG